MRMKDVPVMVKKGEIQMDSGERFKVIDLEQVDRLALTSSITCLNNYDAETNRVVEQLNELRRRLETRLKNRQVMLDELVVAWNTIKARHDIPLAVTIDAVEWPGDGTCKVNLPAAETGGENEKE